MQSLGEFPCFICRTGVGSNNIHCIGCKHWVHKKCSGLKHMKEDPNYRCSRCLGTAQPIDGRPQNEVLVGPDKLEVHVEASFCYLGDMLTATGGCELATTMHVKTPGRSSRNCYLLFHPITSPTRHAVVCTGHAFGTQCSMQARLDT